jgi:energy-coupling factor transport system permease protein
MLTPIDLSEAQESSLLGRTSPLMKLGLAIAWLIGLALTPEPWPPILLAALAIAAGLTVGRVPPRSLARGLAPLLVAAASIALANLLWSSANTDPAATELAHPGPFRITWEAAAAAAALAARVLAIVSVGAVFAQTTDPTRLVDALVQQGRLSERFAYGALAAYQAIPRFGQDLTALRQARRVRGLRGGWHPGLLVGVLVLAIRHGDRMALAMDARAFGSRPRTFYREVPWTSLDAVVALTAVVILAAALALAGQVGR